LQKGDSIFVTGNVRRQEWADKESGAKRSKHIFSVQRFEFLPRAAQASDEVTF
jgi:single-stranded DNA-binding protein